METVRVIRPFRRCGVLLNPGDILSDVPDDLLPKLAGYVEEVPRHRSDMPHPSRSTSKAWIDKGELRTIGPIEDLAHEIVKLTFDDLPLQRRLLTEHCQSHGPAHLGILMEKWCERVAIMEHEGGLSRDEAEEQAAAAYRLAGWLDELRLAGSEICECMGCR